MPEIDIGEVKLKNVRLSFPHLFEPQEAQPDAQGNVGEARYNCSFLIPKTTEEGKANIRACEAAIKAVNLAKWPKGDIKLKADKKALRDGDEERYDGYAGHAYVSAASPKDRPPAVVSNKKQRDPKTGKDSWVRLEAESGVIYAGCYVNAIVRFWAQDNKHGKRINASIEVVQFRADGEAFGAQPVNADDAFDDDDVGLVESEISSDDDTDSLV